MLLKISTTRPVVEIERAGRGGASWIMAPC
jgi:hypothetical protein